MLQFASKQSFSLKSVFRIRIQEGKIDPKIALGIQLKIPNLDPESINPDSKHCLNRMEFNTPLFLAFSVHSRLYLDTVLQYHNIIA